MGLGNLKELRDLFIYNNKIGEDGLRAINGCTNLRRLRMENVDIKRLSLPGLRNLHVLHIKKGRVIEIAPTINNLSQLRELTLFKTGVSKLPHSIKGLKNLEVLTLRGHGLTTLPEDLGDLKKLRVLDLNNTRTYKPAKNIIKQLPTSIAGLTGLEILDLTKLGLNTFPEIMNSKLRLLFAGGNNFAVLPDNLGKLKNLEVLILGCNQKCTLPLSIGRLTKLRVLNVGGSRWKENRQISTGVKMNRVPRELGSLQSLCKLNLKHVGLQEFPAWIGILKGLRILNLDGNRISRLPGRFNAPPRLLVLTFNGNRLRSVPIGFLRGLPRSIILNMNDNLIPPQRLRKYMRRFRPEVPRKILCSRGMHMNNHHRTYKDIRKYGY